MFCLLIRCQDYFNVNNELHRAASPANKRHEVFSRLEDETKAGTLDLEPSKA